LRGGDGPSGNLWRAVFFRPTPRLVVEFTHGPDEPGWTTPRVLAEYAQAGAAERVCGVYLRLVRLRPDDLNLRPEWARVQARFGRWAQAAADYAELLRRPDSDAEVCFEAGCLCLLADDRGAYDKARRYAAACRGEA
jgi:hypothetical protein